MMFWTGFAIGCAVCLALGVVGFIRRSRRLERIAKANYLATLPADQQEALRGFELVNPDWRSYRDVAFPQK